MNLRVKIEALVESAKVDNSLICEKLSKTQKLIKTKRELLPSSLTPLLKRPKTKLHLNPSKTISPMKKVLSLTRSLKNSPERPKKHKPRKLVIHRRGPPPNFLLSKRKQIEHQKKSELDNITVMNIVKNHIKAKQDYYF